ncbi:hypothetical protein [Methylobacterium sp. CM6244]
MAHWKDDVDPALFEASYRPGDRIVVLEEIVASDGRNGRLILEKGRQFEVGMRGGFLFCKLGGSRYNEAVILPEDFRKVQIVSQMSVVQT